MWTNVRVPEVWTSVVIIHTKYVNYDGAFYRIYEERIWQHNDRQV